MLRSETNLAIVHFDLFAKTWVRYWSTEGRALKSAPVTGMQSNQGITISVCCFLPPPLTRKSKR